MTEWPNVFGFHAKLRLRDHWNPGGERAGHRGKIFSPWLWLVRSKGKGSGGELLHGSFAARIHGRRIR